MRACIHRGAHEIGGSLIELEAQGSRLVLDAGLPLELEGIPRRELLADVPGLWADGDGSLLALLISHGHPDHYGLADLVAPSVPIFMGDHAAAILKEAAFFVPGVRPFQVAGRHREPLALGPFVVTPWRVDHSAFDAYALLVEAGGRRLLYTGDVRAHGRKHRTLQALARGARGVDVVLLEGTRIGPQGAAGARRSEREVEAACVEAFRAANGMALAFYSPQNVDRLVTLYRAAKRARRVFVIDLYTAAIAAATGRETIPQAGWEGVRVYLPRSQRRRVIDAQAFERTDAVRAQRIYAEELRERGGEIVLTCRGSMLGELEEAGCLEGAVATWSMWAGYLERPSGRRTVADLERLGVQLSVEHASGHASPADLERFAHQLAAARVVPIHTQGADVFGSHFANVVCYGDGAWWDV